MLQCLSLAAAVLGLSCRATSGYCEPSVDAFFGLPEHYTSLFQIMVSPAHLAHQRYEPSLLIER